MGLSKNKVSQIQWTIRHVSNNSSLGVNPLFGQTQAACLKASMLSEGHGAHFWAKKAKRPVPKVQQITRSIDVAAVAVIKTCLSVH